MYLHPTLTRAGSRTEGEKGGGEVGCTIPRNVCAHPCGVESGGSGSVWGRWSVETRWETESQRATVTTDGTSHRGRHPFTRPLTDRPLRLKSGIRTGASLHGCPTVQRTWGSVKWSSVSFRSSFGLMSDPTSDIPQDEGTRIPRAGLDRRSLPRNTGWRG